MLNGAPAIGWGRFFRQLTPQRQRRLERALSEGGLLLGEYTELVERACLRAYQLQGESPGWERAGVKKAAEAIAGDLISSYVKRKRLFLLVRAATESVIVARLCGAFPEEMPMLQQAPTTACYQAALSASYKLGLRRRIHARIEALKRAER